MTTARRRRSSWAVAASVLAHLGVLAAVLSQHPTLILPTESSGPPEAIIPILILPRTPPPVAGGGAKPAPIQLHRRALRNQPAETPVAPVVIAPPKPAEAPPQAPGPPAPKEPAQPPPPASAAVRAALRTTLGCNDLRLSRDERAACQERLGRGARDAPYIGQPLSGEKRAAFDQAGAAKLANRAGLESAAPRPGPAPPSDYDGDPYVTGVATSVFGPVTHPPSKRAAPKLGPLPP